MEFDLIRVVSGKLRPTDIKYYVGGFPPDFTQTWSLALPDD
jgi:hypothetical protein